MMIDPQEKTPDFYCEKCDGEMYGADPLFEHRSLYLCSDCYCREKFSEEAYHSVNFRFTEKHAMSIADIFGDLWYWAEELKGAV